MEIGEQTWAILDERSAVASIRRKVEQYAEQYGFSDAIAEKLRLIITEAGNNIVLHGQTGCLGIVPDVNGQSISILAIDNGPGITDIESAMCDGVTRLENSTGIGLGSLKRLSTKFEINSAPKVGTVVCCQVEFNPAPRPTPYNVAFANRPYRHEKLSGDALRLRHINHEPWLLIVDGLGHGAKANHAAMAACEAFMGGQFSSPNECIERLHQTLHTTRGAAAAVLRIATDSNQVEYCGIGNTQAYFLNFTGRAGHLLSKNGTLGHTLRRLETVKIDWPPGARLIMNTDGISTKANFRQPAEILKSSPIMMAGLMLRDFGKMHDDCSVMIVEKTKDADS